MKVSIEFVYIRESYTSEFLQLMFNAENTDIDAVLFSSPTITRQEKIYRRKCV